VVNKTLKLYTCLGIFILIGSWFFREEVSMVGMTLSLCVFGINLYWISTAVYTFLESCKGEEPGNILGFLSSIRIFAFLGVILCILFAFGWVPVLIGNNLIVCSLLVTSLFFDNHDTKDQFNE